MAPYTMTINIHNDTHVPLTWMGSSTYHRLNGSTSISHVDHTILPGSKGRVQISKSAGTDGLFTVAFYQLRTLSTEMPIYAMMPASMFSKADVKFVDHKYAVNYERELSEEGKHGAATWWWDERRGEKGMTDGPWSNNVVDVDGEQWKRSRRTGSAPRDIEVWRVTRTLTKDKMEYPDSECTVRITSKSLGHMQYFDKDNYDVSYNS